MQQLYNCIFVSEDNVRTRKWTSACQTKRTQYHAHGANQHCSELLLPSSCSWWFSEAVKIALTEGRQLQRHSSHSKVEMYQCNFLPMICVSWIGLPERTPLSACTTVLCTRSGFDPYEMNRRHKTYFIPIMPNLTQVANFRSVRSVLFVSHQLNWVSGIQGRSSRDCQNNSSHCIYQDVRLPHFLHIKTRHWMGEIAQTKPSKTADQLPSDNLFSSGG